MDADGNGIVNNLDYIAIKLNWAKSHGAIVSKQSVPDVYVSGSTFNFLVSSPSHVTMIAYDAAGREIAKLVDQEMSSGEYSIPHSLKSGVYFVVSNVTDQDGLSYQHVSKIVVE